MAVAERLVCGYLPENQDGEFFPQTSPPGHRVQENSNHVTTLTRVGIGIDGRIAFW